MVSRSVAAPAAAPVAALPAAPVTSPRDPPLSGSPAGSPAASSSRSPPAAHVGAPVDLASDEEDLWEALVLAGRPALEAMASSSGSVAMSESSDSAAIPAPPSNLAKRVSELHVAGSDYDSDEADASGPAEEEDEAPESWLDGSDDDEERPMLKRLRRGNETTAWHPPLPPPPELHPITGQKNCYDPDMEWDYSKPCGVVRLLDAQGKIPHRCYLVEWKCTPLQLTWEWMEKLDRPWVRDMMKRIDEQQSSGGQRAPSAKKSKKSKKSSKRALASAAGTCFMDGLRMALYYLNEPNLVTMEMWDAFEATRPSDIQYGVTREDAVEFFKLLQRESIPLNHEKLQKNFLSSSAANIGTFRSFCQGLPPGVYLASAGEDDLGHCFGVLTFGPDKRPLVMDGYNEAKDPPMTIIPLGHQTWVQYVKWVACVELQPGYQCRHGKRKSRTERKREKRFKLLLEQAKGM